MKVILKKTIFVKSSLDSVNGDVQPHESNNFNDTLINDGIIETITNEVDNEALTYTTIFTFSSLENYATYENRKRQAIDSAYQEELNRINWINENYNKLVTEIYITD